MTRTHSSDFWPQLDTEVRQLRGLGLKWQICKGNHEWVALAPGDGIESMDGFTSHAEALSWVDQHFTRNLQRNKLRRSNAMQEARDDGEKYLLGHGYFTEVQVAPEFTVSELAHWLGIAQMRWGDAVTGRLEGSVINIYQDGVYRAAIHLNSDRPCLSNWADNEA